MSNWQDAISIAALATSFLGVVLALVLLGRVARLARAVDPAPVTARLAALDEGQARLERAVREDFRAAREEGSASGKQLREEVAASIKGLADSVLLQSAEMARQQTERLDVFAGQLRQSAADAAQGIAALGEVNGKAAEALKGAMEAQLTTLRKENGDKLEQMRTTVDEKLQGTLEKRLGESFKLVSDRLESVHKGLGEMQTLATGVGDLKRVLTNVKSRGSWGEVQLGALLEQVLSPGQFAANVATSEGGSERVEFAIRLPGAGDGDGPEVFLPIDAKFPVEDYERLQAAADAGDPAGVAEASRALEARIRQCGKDICGKYINPPRTTDFAIMFLPTEGLYAEVIRQPGLCDDLQRNCRIVVAGPTTLTALLNSLQMGFRTLAIQQRSSEVWQVLGAVKTEFGKFGPVLEKVKKKLEEASRQMDTVGVRERAIHRSLRQVEALPSMEAASLLDVVEAELPPMESDEPDYREAV